MDLSPRKPLIVLVTGISGAGLKTAMNTLEDSGLYGIDHLPLEMIHPAIQVLAREQQIWERGMAFGVSICSPKDVTAFFDLKERLKDSYRLDILFLTAEDDILELRYSATRRRHPLMAEGRKISEAIEVQKGLVDPIKKVADMVMDTSLFSPQQLARMIESRYNYEVAQRSLYVMLISFGFKHGQCRPVDSVFDVRFLKNPFFVKGLKEKTGLDADVKAYVFQDIKSQQLLQRLEAWHRWILPLYYQEGKHFFRIAIGCTGGQHRSVAVVEALYEALSREPSEHVILSKSHRDIAVIR